MNFDTKTITDPISVGFPNLECENLVTEAYREPILCYLEIGIFEMSGPIPGFSV